MTPAKAKRHLLVGPGRAACGLNHPPLTTREPSQVTCNGCRRTIAMADAEVNKRTRPRERRRKL